MSSVSKDKVGEIGPFIFSEKKKKEKKNGLKNESKAAAASNASSFGYSGDSPLEIAKPETEEAVLFRLRTKRGDAMAVADKLHARVFAAPRLDLESLESGYHGLVKENETLVEVTPQIRALGTKVCSFRIANKHHGEAPFEIVLKEKGMAELRAFRVLNCEKRRNYKFDIAAVGCNGAQSEKYVSTYLHFFYFTQYVPRANGRGKFSSVLL